MENEVKLVDGGLAVDDRGCLTFVNNFDFADVKRFYSVSNHKNGFVRAWHGHKIEQKRVLCTVGSAIIACVKVDNWENPSKDLPIQRFVLSSKKPQILYIPSGYANGFMTLEESTQLMFFSTTTLEESKNDDIRFDSKYWNPWHIEER